MKSAIEQMMGDLMDEKQARKRLRMIETEIRYLEKRLAYQKKIRDSSSSDRYLLRVLGLALLVGFLSWIIIPYALSGLSPEILTCVLSFFFIIAVIFIVFALFFKDWDEKSALKVEKGMKCRLRQYRKEKEKIISEHPQLKNADIRPFRIHYWEICIYYSDFVFIFVLVLWFRTHTNQPIITLLFYIAFFISMSIIYIQHRYYKRCVE